MIPTFPNFKRLDIEDKAELQAFTKCLPPYSDFNFACLTCYDTQGDFQWTMLNENLVFRLRDYVTKKPFFTFFGDHCVSDTVERLFDFAQQNGVEPILRLIPESNLTQIGLELNERFAVSEDRDNFDYIYQLSDLSGLASGKFQRKRQKISGFLRDCSTHKLNSINLSDHVFLIRQLLLVWQEKKHRSDAETKIEFQAIERCLSLSNHFDFISLGVFLNGAFVGFTISELLHDGFCMLHFAKADPSIAGLADFLYSQTAKHMSDLGCTKINFQEDLGIPGLRQLKESWRPQFFLKKYSVGRNGILK
jgi:hypothetical protein